MRAFAGRYLIALVVAISLTATGVAAVEWEIDDRVDDIERVPVFVATPPPAGANYLLIGSDTREFVDNPIDREALGDPEQERDKNSDTLMVAHIEPGSQRALVTSFPRDLKVEVPGEERTAKLNSFFGNGGPQAVVDVLKWNFDIDIHHYVEVDFFTFHEVVDAIGSVKVWFARPTRDEFTGLNIEQAPVCKALNGDDALKYVRARNIEELIDGEWQPVGQDAPDLHRIERQQEFIRKLLGLAISKSLGNPWTALLIANGSLDYMKVDAGVGRDQVNELIRAFKTVDVNDPSAVRFETIPAVPDPVAPTSTLVLGDDAQALIDELRTFGAGPLARATVSPDDVKVRVRDGVRTDTARTDQVTRLLARAGFTTLAAKPDGAPSSQSEIRYPPDLLAHAKLLTSYVSDTALVAAPSLHGTIELVLGSTFVGISVPTTTVPTTTVAAAGAGATAPAQVSTPPAAPVVTAGDAEQLDPRAAACN